MSDPAENWDDLADYLVRLHEDVRRLLRVALPETARRMPEVGTDEFERMVRKAVEIIERNG